MNTATVPQKYTGKRKLEVVHQLTQEVIQHEQHIPKKICSHSVSLKAVDALANTNSIIKSTAQLARMTATSVQVFLHDKLNPAIDELEHVVPDTTGKLLEDVNEALHSAYECKNLANVHIKNERGDYTKPSQVIVNDAADYLTEEDEYSFEYEDMDDDNETCDLHIIYEEICGDLDPFDIENVASVINDHITNNIDIINGVVSVTVDIPDWLHIDHWWDVVDELTEFYTSCDIDYLMSSDELSVFSLTI